MDENLRHFLEQRQSTMNPELKEGIQHLHSTILSRMKHSICQVSKQRLSECGQNQQVLTTYELPDHSILNVGIEKFECCEMLYDPSSFPSLRHRDLLSISELAYNYIMKNSETYRKDLYNDMILSGGSFMFEGGTERMEYDMKQFALSGYRVKVVKKSDTIPRVYSSWMGASMLAQWSEDHEDKWISKMEYEEKGFNFHKY
nr:unnamed protein product [Naegleria fowleri]